MSDDLITAVYGKWSLRRCRRHGVNHWVAGSLSACGIDAPGRSPAPYASLWLAPDRKARTCGNCLRLTNLGEPAPEHFERREGS